MPTRRELESISNRLTGTETWKNKPVGNVSWQGGANTVRDYPIYKVIGGNILEGLSVQGCTKVVSEITSVPTYDVESVTNTINGVAVVEDVRTGKRFLMIHDERTNIPNDIIAGSWVLGSLAKATIGNGADPVVNQTFVIPLHVI